jgi:hypothetical protein
MTRDDERKEVATDFAARLSWSEVAAEVLIAISKTDQECTERSRPMNALHVDACAHIQSYKILQELYDGGYYPQRPSRRDYRQRMRQIEADLQNLRHLFEERERDCSDQAKYCEAKLQSRQALKENHCTDLDDIPGLVDLVREQCSSELLEYSKTDVGLHPEKFPDMLEMLARDEASPADVL